MLERRIGVQLRVKMPLLFTGGGVQRKQALVSGTQEERIADFNRRHFVSDFTRIVRLFQVAGAEHPGFLQVLHVIGVNLLQRGEALAFLVTAIGRPVAVGDGGNRCGRRSVGAQGAVDFLRVVKTSPGQHAAADQQGDDQRANGASGRHRQTTPDKGQDQPDAKEDEDIATRRQRPEVEADFPDAPDHGRQQQRGVQPQRSALAAQQHHGHAQHHQTGDRIVPGAAKHDQPCSAD